MIKSFLIFLFSLWLFTAGAQNPNNNGHHHNGGNSGNGQGNYPDEDPNDDPDEETTTVPIDNWVWVLVVGGVLYGYYINGKKRKVLFTNN